MNSSIAKVDEGWRSLKTANPSLRRESVDDSVGSKLRGALGLRSALPREVAILRCPSARGAE